MDVWQWSCHHQINSTCRHLIRWADWAYLWHYIIVSTICWSFFFHSKSKLIVNCLWVPEKKNQTNSGGAQLIIVNFFRRANRHFYWFRINEFTKAKKKTVEKEWNERNSKNNAENWNYFYPLTVDAYAIVQQLTTNCQLCFSSAQLCFALLFFSSSFSASSSCFYMKLSWNFMIKCTERKYFLLYVRLFVSLFVCLLVCCVLLVNYHANVQQHVVKRTLAASHTDK